MGKCKWCGKKMKWWLIFDLVPHDYCSPECDNAALEHEVKVMRARFRAMDGDY